MYRFMIKSKINIKMMLIKSKLLQTRKHHISTSQVTIQQFIIYANTMNEIRRTLNLLIMYLKCYFVPIESLSYLVDRGRGQYMSIMKTNKLFKMKPLKVIIFLSIYSRSLIQYIYFWQKINLYVVFSSFVVFKFDILESKNNLVYIVNFQILIFS